MLSPKEDEKKQSKDFSSSTRDSSSEPEIRWEEEFKQTIPKWKKFLEETESFLEVTNEFLQELRNPPVNTPTRNLQEIHKKIEGTVKRENLLPHRVTLEQLEELNKFRRQSATIKKDIEAKFKEIESILTEETNKVILELNKVSDTDLPAKVKTQEEAVRKLSKFYNFALVISDSPGKLELLSMLKKNLDGLNVNDSKTPKSLLSLTPSPPAASFGSGSVLPERKEEDSDDENLEAGDGQQVSKLSLAGSSNDQQPQPTQRLASESNGIPQQPVSDLSAATSTGTHSIGASVSGFFSQSSSNPQTPAPLATNSIGVEAEEAETSGLGCSKG